MFANIFVSYLELKKSLYGLFSQCGPILEIVAMKTPKMRGQAFIVFKDANSAGTAIRALQGFLFYDKPIRIAYAKSKSDAVAMLDGTYVDKLKAQGKKKDDSMSSLNHVALLFVNFFRKNKRYTTGKKSWHSKLSKSHSLRGENSPKHNRRYAIHGLPAVRFALSSC